jgi:hypothetical protein
MTNMNARLRLSSVEETALLMLEKKIRATHYPDPKDQRAFLDRQASTVVRTSLISVRERTSYSPFLVTG